MRCYCCVACCLLILLFIFEGLYYYVFVCFLGLFYYLFVCCCYFCFSGGGRCCSNAPTISPIFPLIKKNCEKQKSLLRC